MKNVFITIYQSLSYIASEMIIEDFCLNSCSQITNQGLILFAEETPSLIKLQLRWVKRLNVESIKKVIEKCPLLRFIDVSCCANIQEDFTEFLEMHNHNLTFIKDELPDFTPVGDQAPRIDMNGVTGWIQDHHNKNDKTKNIDNEDKDSLASLDEDWEALGIDISIFDIKFPE